MWCGTWRDWTSPRPTREEVVQGAVVVLSYPDLEIADVAIAEETPAFPYVPGLLSFRETPVLLEVLQSLTIMPEPPDTGRSRLRSPSQVRAGLPFGTAG